MDILLDNFAWMTFNVILALAGVLLGRQLLTSKKTSSRLILFVLWLLFVPNTIYLITDLQHFPEQFLQLNLVNKLFLIGQYLILSSLGIITFILGVQPFEKILSRTKLTKNKQTKTLILILINYLIAFGVFLGRLERVFSWEVFTNFPKVINISINSLSSLETTIFIVIFGTTINLIYFLARQRLRFNT